MQKAAWVDVTDNGRECSLSEWGKLIFSHAADEIYGEKLLHPRQNLFSSPQTRTQDIKADNLENNYDKQRDRQSIWIYGIGLKHNHLNFNLRALLEEELGKKRPSTHEFNLLSKEQGRRGFCYFEND